MENIFDTIWTTLISPSSSSVPAPLPSDIMEVKSKPVLWICSGYSDSVSSSTVWIYAFTPVDRDRINAMPMIPMEPANDVSSVLAFFVFRLLKLRDSAVRKDMEDFPMFLCCGSSCVPSSIRNGSESDRIFPSRSFTIRVAYCSASSGLWVTMTTRRSFATSLKRSMTCTLVSLSSAPVGSSASRISGSFTRARAIATLCICPPDIWFGFL